MILLRSFLSGHIRIKRTLEYYDAGIGPRVPFGGGFGPTVSANFAVALGDFTTLSSTSTMPTGGSISRAGNAMLYDSTGKLTYAPNNLIGRSNDLNSASWTRLNSLTVASGVTDPYGGTNAQTLTAGASSAQVFQAVAFSSANLYNFVNSIWIRRRTGSGTVTLYKADYNTGVVVSLTSAWQQFSVSGAGNSNGNAYFNLIISTNGDAIDVYMPTLSVVTYETSARSGDQVFTTTTSAYYGPRFDYDPVTLQPKGLLVEGTRTNIAPSVGNYTRVNCSFTGTTTTAPDGTSITPLTVTTTAVTNSYAVVTATANTMTYSIYAKKGSAATDANRFGIYNNTTSSNVLFFGFNYDTGAITYTTGSSGASAVDVGNGWWRISITPPSGIISGNTIIIYQGFSGGSETAGEYAYVWGAQLEAANFASSYIPTVASSVARAAETFSLTGYANRLVEAYYIDEQTGGSYSGNSALSTGTVTISPPTFGWVTSLRAYTNAYAGSVSTPSWLSFSRAGNAMMTDSTGTLTFAANNLLLNTAALATQTVTTGIIPTCDVILSFKGTGSVAISGGYTGTLAGTGASDRVFLKFTTTTASLTFTVTGTVTEAQLERVTYQTAPSAYIPTTSAAVYGPRYDYDPSTVPATPRGLLIEESRANLLTYSEQFDNAAWTLGSVLAFGSGSIVNAIASPDGTATADKVVPTSGAQGQVSQNVTMTDNTTYTASVYVKDAGLGTATITIITKAGIATGIQVNLTTGAITAINSGTGTATNVGNGWWRLSTPVNVSTGAITPRIRLYLPQVSGATGDGVSGVYLWGAQVEAGSFATSYIPTTTASVTRAADVAQLTGSALTTANPNNSTLILEGTQNDVRLGNMWMLSVSDGTANNEFGLTNYTTVMYAQETIGGTVKAAAIGSFTAGSILRASVAVSATQVSGSLNGANVVSQTTSLGTFTPTIARFGRSMVSATMCGYIRSFAAYNQKLPDAILKQKSVIGSPY